MYKVCIHKKYTDEIRNRLQSGELDVADLYQMDSATRFAKFSEFLPESAAKHINSDFESKLVLKNKQRGLQNWVNKQIDVPEPAKRDLLSKVQRMDKVLSETDQQNFLADLAETKLGARVTIDQANELSRLAKAVETTAPGTMEHGYARADFDQYIEDLINPSNKEGLKDTVKGLVGDIKKNKLNVFPYLGGISKSIKAALDNSALFFQGAKTFFTNPKEWFINARKSFKYMFDTFGGKNVMREIRASMYADKEFDLAVKAKLAIGVDDAIPTSVQEKIPVIGKAFQASDNAFRGFLFKTRFDVFKKYLQIAKDAGMDINDKEWLESIGNIVNSQTGRGKMPEFLGGERAANTANLFFFSPRTIISQLDTFIHPLTGGNGYKGLTDFSKEANFNRKVAIKSLGKIIAGIATIMTVSNVFDPGSAETDPRSSDFGKLKFGDTRFDISGGLGSIITLLSRISTSTKIVNGKKIKLNDPKQYKGDTSGDVLKDFFQNKLSPLASVINDTTLRHKTFNGEKPTFFNELNNFIAPLPISNFIQTAQDENAANLWATAIADAVGIRTNTYSTKK